MNSSIKNTIALVWMIILVSCSQKIATHNSPREITTIGENLDDYFTALTYLKKFNGVVLAYKNDSLVLEKSYNINTDTNSSTFVTTDYQFDIHSISKLMTNYLVIKLEREDQLKVNQTLDTFHPDFPQGESITLQMLLDHSSGLPRELYHFEGNEFDLTTNEIIEFAKLQPLLFEPGADTQYSNIGYELLYDIISKTYRKPFAQCIVDEIFIPLKMNNSGAHFFSNANRIQKLAKNHTLEDSTIIQVPNIMDDEFKTARLFSTASDLNTFLNHIKEPPFSSIKKENNVIAKDGGSKGIRAQVYTDLDHNFNFILLANYDEIPFFKTIDDMIKILKSEPFEVPKELNRKAIHLPNDTLKKFTGAYSFADFNGLILTIKIENKNLVVFQNGEKIGTLKAETETIFFENPKAPESFEFIQNDIGTYDVLMGWKGITLEGKKENN